MKRIVITILSILLCIVMLRAELLYRITSPDGSHSAYILGSHHMAPLSVLDGIEGYKEAFAEADVVMGEIDMMSDSAHIMERQIFMQYGLAPADSTLTKLLSAEQVKALDALLAKYMGQIGMAANFDMFKPAVLTTSLSMLIMQQTLPGFNPQEQIDLFVQAKAKIAGKKVVALESLGYQLSVFLGSPISEQLDQLVEVIEDEQKGIEEAQKLNEAYFSHDIDAMEAIMENSDSEEYIERLVYQRNRNWIPLIEQQIEKAPTLIVVGAGHLPSDKGVLQMLRNDGYKVEPID